MRGAVSWRGFGTQVDRCVGLQITMVCKGVQSGTRRSTVGREATPLMGFTYDGAGLALVFVERLMRGRK